MLSRRTELPDAPASEPTPTTPPTVRRRARRRTGPARRWIALAVLIALLVILGGGAGGGYLYARSYQAQLEGRLTAAFTAGETDLTEGKNLLKKGSTDRDPAEIAAADAKFASAETHFRAVKRELAQASLLHQVSSLPVAHGYLAPRTRSVDGLANMGIALAEAAAAGGAVDAALVKPDAGGDQHGGARMVAVLQQAEPGLALVAGAFQRAQAAAATVDPAVLTAGQRKTFLAAAAEIRSGLAAVQNLVQLLPVLRDVLGGNGPRTYLMLQVDTGELRPGGGFIGSFSLISASNGDLKVIKSAAVDNLDNPRPSSGQSGYQAPPASMLEFLGSKSWVLGDSNFFPDFARNASWAEKFLAKELNGQQVDGVISIDTQAIAQMLEVTGPIAIPEYHTTVNAKTFVEDVFDRINGPGLTSVSPTVRKQFLGVVAGHIMGAVADLPPTKWPSLIAELNTAAERRDMQMYFNRDPVQSQMSKFGWTGALNVQPPGDFMLETESNFGGTKANHYLTRNYDLVLTRDGPTLHHKLTVHLIDDTRRVQTAEVEYYRAYQQLYVLDSATNLKMTGPKPPQRPMPKTDLPPGTSLMEGWLQINLVGRYGTWDTTFEWDTPWKGDAHGGGVLYWEKQPGTLADRLDISFVSDGKTVTGHGDLGQDQVVSFGPNGIQVAPGHAASASLPSLSL